jgi:hypothetical protein
MSQSRNFCPPSWAFLPCLLLAALGVFTGALGAIQDAGRTWANTLLLSNYLIGVSTGALVLIALFYVSGARWAAPLRRLPEALAAALPVGAVGLAGVLFLRPSLYSWAVHPQPGEEVLSPLRAVWLQRPFFLVRALVYLTIWMTFAGVMVRNSHLRDRTGNPAFTRRNTRLAAGFLVAFGLTCWLSSHDWLMSLEPDWTSTIFGVYNFAGLFLSALAAVTLLAVCFRVDTDRLHDLGTLLFGFSCFWMYTWFCQYLLIWYTNHPEETAYFLRRTRGAGPSLLLVALVLNWGIPFLVLLFRDAKRSPAILAAVALVVLAGRWVDLFVMVFPSQVETLAEPGYLEAGLALGAAGLFGLIVLRALTRAPLVPVEDPEPTPEAAASHA